MADDDPTILQTSSATEAAIERLEPASVVPDATPVSETALPSGTVAQGETSDARHAAAGRNIDAMLNVDLRVQVILGHARMPISQLLKLSRGSVIELDRRIGEQVDVVINDRLVARGDLVKLEGGQIGVTLTEILKDYVMDN